MVVVSKRSLALGGQKVVGAALQAGLPENSPYLACLPIPWQSSQTWSLVDPAWGSLFANCLFPKAVVK